MCDLSGSHDMLITLLVRYICWKYCYYCDIYVYIACTFARHLSLGSSMVRASHRLSESCRFDPRLGLRNRFSDVRVWRTFIYHSFMKEVPHQNKSVSLPNKVTERKLVAFDSFLKKFISLRRVRPFHNGNQSKCTVMNTQVGLNNTIHYTTIIIWSILFSPSVVIYL